ncbi:unnamed protein product [Zymoseptoria tritici ST99CH_3D7]|uniref:DUF1776-domain-containing protein n=1 Tax=Zymoseptoria tritici (strain ST99CH_3D7) TaxID=1276538 RepID=A0A1X7RS06_ZYMT9|nr:unnamed protein product [Zymoseptoria tritici ST99CH_3D7]
MTDAQHLIDFARAQFNEIADGVERQFDSIAHSLRDSFDSSSIPVRRPVQRLPPPTTWQVAERWMLKNKALTAALAAFVVTGTAGTAFYYIKSKDARRKRRARKSHSGARTDVVVISGAVANPLTAALYLDLERRGFVVYVLCPTAEDEHFVRSQSRVDLLPLPLDVLDPFKAQTQLARFQDLLERDHRAFDHAESHRLRFMGLVLVPDTQVAPMRVEDTSSEEWSMVLNAKVLNTVATTQLLVPAVTRHKARVLLLTQSVAPSLRLASHSMESAVYGALQVFAASLAAELKEDDIPLTHIKIGSMDIPAISAKQRREGVPAPRLKPTPLRALHDSVFDTLVAKSPSRTLHVGRGSLTYDLIGKWMPPAFIAWMMGAGKQRLPQAKAAVNKEEDLRSSTGSLTWDKVELSDQEA